jgi:glutamate-1-semialdehyde 2,1-aminomutase
VRQISGERRAPGFQSQSLFDRGTRAFPGGTTRFWIERNPIPRYIKRGDGAYVIDADGQRFLDLNNNNTALIHGHAFKPIVEAVSRILHDGTCFSNPTETELELAELLINRVPAVERVRFMNSGTEAVMFAIKAARAYSGRTSIAKIEGAFHGAYDWAEAGQVSTPSNWGPAEQPNPVPAYDGTPASVGQDVVMLRLNDVESVRRTLAEAGNRLAGILLDPTPSRGGLIPPAPDFIAAIVEMAKTHGILIIADEVLNLRQGYTGASDRYGIKPDLVCMGKIIGGGFPIGAVGGSEGVMAVFDGTSERVRVRQGGTFTANPVSMVAGRVCMEAMTEGAFARLEQMGDRLRAGLTQAIEQSGAPFSVTGVASLFLIHPKRTAPREFREAFPSPEEAALERDMCTYFRDKGVLLSAGATSCLSTAMNDEDIAHVVDVFGDFVRTRG